MTPHARQKVVRYFRLHPKSNARDIGRACGVTEAQAARIMRAVREWDTTPVDVEPGTLTRKGLVWARVTPPESGDCNECAYVVPCREMVVVYYAEAGCFRALRQEIIKDGNNKHERERTNGNGRKDSDNRA